MSLTLAEARARADLVSEVRTAVWLDLTDVSSYRCRAVIEVACRRPGDTFLELSGAEDLEVRLDGERLEVAYDGHRIPLAGLAGRARVEVSARMPYVTDGDGMHTVTDPADGERYVNGYTAMDVARKVIPCFDQPDLKTTIELSVTAPEHWTVLANGPLASRDGGRWRFAPTPPVSTYLFFVAGGPWHSVTWTEEYPAGSGRGLPFGWHARASLAAELDRDAAELREITSRCFAHYTATFDEPYPFADYQQVFTPGLNWGAMEFPGCVAFRDELLFRGRPTAMQRHGRASVIAHEMAHMWFGDLVTMRWWEDTWLNESFADYMGYEVAGRAAGYADSWVACSMRRKPTAYRADRRRSTHPIAEDADRVADVDTAFGNFDMITYAKGNAVLRQLVAWLGEDDFLAGVNRHLSAHRFGNATLADFLDALDACTDRDVRGWARAWLRSTGFDRVVVTRDGGVPVLTREGSRPHRFTVTGYDNRLAVVASRVVDLADEPVRLEELAGLVVVPNARDETYARVVLDERSWHRLRAGLSDVGDPLTRALLWWTAVDACEDRRMPVAELVALAVGQLPAERHPVVLEGAAAAVLRVLRRYGSPAEVPEALAALAGLGEQALRRGDEDLSPAAARLLAATSADAGLLAGWLAGATGPAAGLPAPDREVRWEVVQRLASLGDASRVAAELERDRSTAGEQAALRARAAVPTAEAKREAWSLLMGGSLSNRDFEAVAAGFWGWEQAELVRPWLGRYAVDGAALGRRTGQAFGKVLVDAFPWLPLDDADRRAVRDSLATELAGEVPTVLRRSWDDELDDLDRVLGG